MHNQIKEEPLVSVLVSCYNVERFIERGMTAILNQGYKNCEFIIVDDGSTDNTLKQLQEWKKKDGRIHLICHESNQGLGAARNTGLQNARGKYISFMDVDDLPHENLVEYCVGEMETRQTDMMIFGFNAIMADNTSDVNRVEYKEIFLTNNQELKDIFIEEILLARHGFGFVCTKFYKASFLRRNSISFGNHRIQQDMPFNLDAFRKVERIFISPQVLYDYFIYSTGNNGSRYIPNRYEIYLDIDRRINELLKKWEIGDSHSKRFLNQRLVVGITKFINYDLNHQNCNLSKEQKKEIFNHILSNSRLKESLDYINKDNRTDYRFRIQAKLLLRNNYKLYRAYEKTYKFLYNIYLKLK